MHRLIKNLYLSIIQAPTEPNNHNGRENCVEARFNPDDYTWNDINCDAARNWICKIQRGKSLQVRFIYTIKILTGYLSHLEQIKNAI